MDYERARDAIIADGTAVYGSLVDYFYATAEAMAARGQDEGAEQHRWCGQLLGAYRTQSQAGFGIADSEIDNPHGPWHAAPASCSELYLRMGLSPGEHPLVRAAFLHGLWETRALWRSIATALAPKRRLIIEGAVVAHIEAAESYQARALPSEFAMDVAEHWRTAATLALSTRRVDLIDARIASLRGAIGHTIAEPIWAHKLVEVEVDLATSTTDHARLEEIELLLKDLDQSLAASPSLSHVRQALVGTCARVETLLGRPPTTAAMAGRRARICAATAEAESEPLKKAMDWRNAAEQFEYAGLDEEATHAKAQMRAENRRAVRSGALKRAEISTPIDTTLADDRVSALLNAPSAELVLMNLLRADGLVSLEGVDTIEQREPNSLWDLMSTVQIVGDRMHAPVGSDSARAAMLRERGFVGLNVQLQNELILMPLFRALRTDFHISADDIGSVLALSSATTSSDIRLAFPGLRAFEREDYVVALHILVPRLEAMVRAYLYRHGADTTSIDNGLSRERTFGSLLDKGRDAGLLSEPQHALLTLVLTDEAGLNLRNKIAHGLARSGDFTPSNACRVIQLMLLVTKLALVADGAGATSAAET